MKRVIGILLLICFAAIVSSLYAVVKEERNYTMEEERIEHKTEREEEPSSGQPSEEEQKKSFGKRFLKELKEWVVSLVVAVLIVMVCRTFLFTLIRVDGRSMQQTLQDRERLFVTVLDVKLGGADRGDVVICHYPGRTNKNFLGITEKTNFVKRVVAVEGDTVWRENRVTYVRYGDTGEVVALDPDYETSYIGYAGFDQEYDEYTLVKDEYFVVGDNRYNSHDSRDWNDQDSSMDVGPITKDMLVGRVRCVFWPLNAIRGVK